MERLKDEPYHIAVEIVNKQCRGLKALRDAGVKEYTLTDIRGSPGSRTRHLARISSEEVRKLPKDTVILARSRDRASISFDTDGCDVCKAVLSHDSFLVSGRHVEGHKLVYSFVTPSFDAFKSIMSTLEAGGLQPKILEAAKFSPRGVLTEKQERTLWLALRMGFFDYPRKITMLELSRTLGVGLSTLSETIRRGTRRLMESHFET